jgi:hypothetical protein
MKQGVKGQRSVQIVLAIGATLAASTCQASNIHRFHSTVFYQIAVTEAASIGVATMGPDGMIELRLRATGPGGMVGEGFLTYPPSDPQYAEILRHLGGLKPGETKSVPPWPD